MSCAHWEASNTRVRLSLSLQPTHTHWIQQICRINLCYYHTDMKVTRKLFIVGQRACAVTLLQLFLHGLWSSLSLKRVHYSSPGFAKNGLFSQWPGVTYPTACTSLPTPPGHPPPPGQTAILLAPPVTEILEPPAHCSRPPVPGGASAWWIGQTPRSIVAPNTVNTTMLVFCFQLAYNASGGSIVGELKLFIHIYRCRLNITAAGESQSSVQTSSNPRAF